MKKPHFFKVKSRIGLTNKPVRQTEFNNGVEDGAPAVLTPEFLGEFPHASLDQFIFSDPEDIVRDYYHIMVEEMVACKEFINHRLKKGETQIVVGGDNTVTFASLLAVQERWGDIQRNGYIQFDSHGESNSHKGSPSKNFHGMYLRPFFAAFDIPEIEALIPQKLKPSQAMFFGDMILDGDEPEFFRTMGFQTVNLAQFTADPGTVLQALEKFLKRFDHVHVNLDVDVFHRSVAGATGIPEDGKWMKSEIFTLLKKIAQHPSVSLDISEINPRKTGKKRTIEVAQEIVKLFAI